jgi:serine protease
MNLHLAYEKALPHAREPRIGGIFTPFGAPRTGSTASGSGRAGASRAQARRAAAASCTEPACPLAYQGGPVQHNPKIYLLLWGPNWSTDSIQNIAGGVLQDFYSDLGQSWDNWSTTMYQYPDAIGSPVFSGQEFAGVAQDTNTPPFLATQDQLAAEAEAFARSTGITDIADSQVVVATQSGTCPDEFYAPGVCPNTGPGLNCGWHGLTSNLGLPFIDLPYEPDAGTLCGGYANGGRFDGFSIVGGVENAETITDPNPGTGWVDPVNGKQIGGKCAGYGFTTVTWNTTWGIATWAMLPLFSNSALASTGSGCVAAGPPQDTVTVTPRGPAGSLIGTSTLLQMTASSSLGLPETFSATGLPPGLSISSSGLIRGAATTVGTYDVRVRATDSEGVAGSTTFPWTVIHLPICGPRICPTRSAHPPAAS